MNGRMDEERVSRDLVLMIKTRTAIYEERGDLGRTPATCMNQDSGSMLPIEIKKK